MLFDFVCLVWDFCLVRDILGFFCFFLGSLYIFSYVIFTCFEKFMGRLIKYTKLKFDNTACMLCYIECRNDQCSNAKNSFT